MRILARLALRGASTRHVVNTLLSNTRKTPSDTCLLPETMTPGVRETFPLKHSRSFLTAHRACSCQGVVSNPGPPSHLVVELWGAGVVEEASELAAGSLR